MAKRYPGVRPRGNSVQVDLVFKGRRSRFSLDIPPTPLSLEYASNLRGKAKLEIAQGTFNPAKFFPNSKSSLVANSAIPKIEKALQIYLRDTERTLSTSTYRDYKSAIDCHLIPSFGSLRLDELSTVDIKDWIAGKDISAKRINNILIPIRKVFSDAYYAERIHSNPFDRIKNLPHRTKAPDPFTLEEIGKILKECTDLVRALFQFAFWTGLRTSELIALEWPDIDSKYKQAYINKAEVRGQLKGTKTYSGTRTVQLFLPALNALKLAKSACSNHSNRVFINPHTMQPWTSDGQIRKTAWIPALNRAKVRYRRPYQTRHTYASQLLSLSVEPMWVAQQMGHKDWGMIRRVYGRWINDSRPDITGNIEAKLAQIGHKVT